MQTPEQGEQVQTEWREWAKKVRKGQLEQTAKAWAKLGKKPPIFKPREERNAGKTVLKVTAKREHKQPEKAKEAGVSRSTGQGNPQGFACPTCWGVPKNLRNDGHSIARHLPVNPEAKRYRDTEFCDGQGKIAVAVMETGWAQGVEPKQQMSAKKWRLGQGAKS